MSEKRKLNFELSSQQLKIKNLLNKQFVQTEVWAISDQYPNRNNSAFTYDSLNDGKSTVTNKPVLGAFGLKGKPDFNAHDGQLTYDPENQNPYWEYDKGERVVGVIRESDKVDIKEKDGLHWLVFTCCLWTSYNYKAVKNVLKNKTKKVSVEVEVEESYIDENGVEVITKFNFLGVTILGNDVSEGIPNAHMSILEKMESAMFSKQVECLNFAYNQMENQEQDNIGKHERTVAEIFGLSQSSDIDNKKEEVFSSEKESDIDIGSENEKTEEIIMAKKGGIVGMQLTYEVKRELIEKYLRDNSKVNGEESECDCCAWVADLDETLVYFYLNGSYFSAPYTITEAEENNEVTVDLEQKEQVVRSWAKFSEEEPASKEEAPEKEIESEKEVEPKEEPKEEIQKESAPEDKEEVPEKETESEKEVEPEKETESEKENKECSFASNERQDAGKETDQPAAKEVVQFVNVNGEEVDITSLLEKFNEVTANFASKSNEFDELNAKFSALQADVTAKVHQEMITFAQNMINSEEELNDEADATIKTEMFEAVKADVEAEKFATIEDVEKNVTSKLALALYAKKQSNKEHTQKEFSVTIPSVPVGTKVVKTDAEVLNEASKKLENI